MKTRKLNQTELRSLVESVVCESDDGISRKEFLLRKVMGKCKDLFHDYDVMSVNVEDLKPFIKNAEAYAALNDSLDQIYVALTRIRDTLRAERNGSITTRLNGEEL